MSLLPSRLFSLSCTSRAVSRVCRCTAASTPLRYKSSKKKDILVPLPKPSAGSASAQPSISFQSTQEVLDRIKEEQKSEDYISIFRQAAVNNLVNNEVYQEILRKLCKEGQLDDAVKILKGSKSTDIISYLVVIYSCTLANRKADVQALITEINKVPGGQSFTFDPLLEYLENKPAGEGENTTNLELAAYDTMLNGYLLVGDAALATEILDMMDEKKLATDLHYAKVMNVLGTTGAVSEAEALMARMVERNVSISHAATCAQIIWVLCSTGKVDQGFAMYEHTRSRGLPLEEFAPKALEVLSQYNLDRTVKLLQRDGMAAGADAFAPVIQALLSSNQQERGIELLREVETKRLPVSQGLVLVAVKLLSRAGYMQRALDWVDRLEKQGGALNEDIHAAVLSTFMYHGRTQLAFKKLAAVRTSGELNTTLYNVVIQGLVHRGQLDEAWGMLNRMKQDGIAPNAQTFASLAQCAEHGCLQRAEEAIIKAQQEYGIEASCEMLMKLAQGTASSGNLSQAWKIVSMMEQSPDATSPILLKTYNDILHTMVTLFRPIPECEDVCKRMLSRNIFPDAATYEALILSHINEGSLPIAFGLFEKVKELHLVPTLRTIKNLHSACFSSSNMDWYNKHVS